MRMKMRTVLLLAFCLVIIITTTKCSASTEEQHELVDPVEEVDETEEEDPSPRPIRASSATAATPRKRARGRKNGGGTTGSSGTVQKRRLPTATFRPTRAPLFEASPPDPYMESGIVGPTGHYGHSHSPPTRDPYYSPSKYERERRRKQRIKLASEAPRVPLPQNSFDDPGPAVLHNPGYHQQQQPKPGKNYAFAYAVGDQEEDFSHKQAKDGPITIGEYRITLPDGRTQVVRYTAGGKHGYKADVTYESPDGKSGPGPSGFQHHKQYHEPVNPTHHLTATPASSFNSNRIIKSRPLKNVALHSNEDVEYSPQSHDVEYQPPHPSPKIRLKAGGQIIPSPTPSAEYLNGISSTTPTPRPNSIYDKISPFRGGKYSGSEELAYAHEHSPRAGPARSKSKHVAKQVATPAASFYDSPSPSPYPHKTTLLPGPTKKYKNHGSGQSTHHQYVGSHQPQANHVNEYIRPQQKHIQYLQETPHHHHVQHHPTPLIAKPVKEHSQHLVPLDHYKTGPVQVSYAAPAHKIKKPKKSKHGIHNPLGQYLLQAPVTAQTPVNSYHSTPSGLVQKEPFHYFNSFHHNNLNNHGFRQLSASPTPVSSVTHNDSPYPNAYPVSIYSTGPTAPTQPRMRLPEPPSTGGHVYLETPASGERPNRLGIKEALSRLPSRDLPTPKTTIHPYEVGAVDYGKGVAYGNSQQDRGFPGTQYGNFEGNFHSGLDNLDHKNSLFYSVTSPATTGLGGGNPDIGYFPHDVSDQFNFLDGLHNFDIEQANVREIRQPRPSRVGGRLSRRVNRRPDKRRGVPAPSSESSKEDMEMVSTSPRPARQRQRQRQQQQRTTMRTTSPRTVQPTRTSPPPSPTTSRTRGRRRRVRTQQPETRPTMQAMVESRRPRTRSRNNSSK